MNIAVLLERSAARWPDRSALIHGDLTVTYEQLSRQVAALAAGLLQDGLSPGDRVAILQKNGLPLLQTILACFYAGLVAVPMNARSTPAEVESMATTAEPIASVVGPEYLEHAQRMRTAQALYLTTPGHGYPTVDELMTAGDLSTRGVRCVSPEDPAWLFFTSGTTGVMKGATLTHRSLMSMVLAYLADIRGGKSGEAVIHAAPLTHGSGLYALPPITRGAVQILTATSSYDPDHLLDLVELHGASDIAFLAPTMLNRLVRAQSQRPRDLSTLENIVYGGAPMYVDDLREALEELGPVLTQIYGQAEAPVTITYLDRQAHADALDAGDDRLASAGVPYTSVEVAVDEGGAVAPEGTGEILVRGDVLMSGYWEAPEETNAALKDGWLHTGDVGRLEADGHLYLLDRSKDVVISGGSNVYPREVEDVVLEHPDVREAVVVGAPDDEWGERVVAVLVTEPAATKNHETLEAELDARCRERLSGYKIPRQYEWVKELPKSPYGKILKREVRARFWEGRERAI